MPEAEAATEADWDTEYLAPIIAVKVVDGLDEAIALYPAMESFLMQDFLDQEDYAASRQQLTTLLS